MERFNSIYLFTTENIAGYMKDLDLTNKKIITVAGSSDHAINAIVQGATDITTFDINPLAKYYMDLKLAAIKELSFEKFKEMFLYENEKNFDYETIKKLHMDEKSKRFWLEKLEEFDNNGLELRKSKLFNTKYFNPNKKIDENIYLKNEKYGIIGDKLSSTRISFIHSNITDLKLDEEYDYMFLSNISDYLNNMYDSNYLEKYKDLIDSFRKKVKTIFFAYVYDVDSSNPRSDIDNLELVRKKFPSMKILKVDTALDGKEEKINDAVFIIEGGI